MHRPPKQHLHPTIENKSIIAAHVRADLPPLPFSPFRAAGAHLPHLLSSLPRPAFSRPFADARLVGGFSFEARKHARGGQRTAPRWMMKWGEPCAGSLRGTHRARVFATEGAPVCLCAAGSGDPYACAGIRTAPPFVLYGEVISVGTQRWGPDSCSLRGASNFAVAPEWSAELAEGSMCEWGYGV